MQRIVAPRIVMAYRTVGTEAVLAAARVPPIDLVVDKMSWVAEYTKGDAETRGYPAHYERVKGLREQAQSRMMIKWRNRLEGLSNGPGGGYPYNT